MAGARERVRARVRECILAVGAHAGDVEITSGATLLKHVHQGWEAHIVHLSMGEKGHPSLAASEYAKQKSVEAQEAAKLLGAKAYFLPCKDGEIEPSREIATELARLIRQTCPQALITHWKESIHSDHSAAYQITRQALFIAANHHFQLGLPSHWVPAVYYAENWEDSDGFQPYIYVDVSEVMSDWERAVRVYALFRGEVSKFPYWDYYQSLTRLRGIQVGCAYAQAFAVDAHRRRHRVEVL